MNVRDMSVQAVPSDFSVRIEIRGCRCYVRTNRLSFLYPIKMDRIKSSTIRSQDSKPRSKVKQVRADEKITSTPTPVRQDLLDLVQLLHVDNSSLPVAKAPTRLRTTMMQHQSQGLGWLQAMANPKITSAPDSPPIQLWKKATSDEGKDSFTHLITRESQDAEPELGHGGLLADDMGLGKTLMIIAFVLARLEMSGNFAKQLPASTGKQARDMVLIVAPVGVAPQWADQFQHHVQPDTLNVRLENVHEPAYPFTARLLHSFDVVVTTYETHLRHHRRQMETDALQRNERPSVHWCSSSSLLCDTTTWQEMLNLES